jgi:hypothetical protein
MIFYSKILISWDIIDNNKPMEGVYMTMRISIRISCDCGNDHVFYLKEYIFKSGEREFSLSDTFRNNSMFDVSNDPGLGGSIEVVCKNCKKHITIS